jgi:pimeloyl-ACP methyl ester carboxylesterase
VRRIAPLLAAAALLLAGCGGEELVTERIGDGPAAVTIIRPEGLDDDVPVVLFLHGWGATEPRAYRPWLEHLAREGNAVVYPRYQDSFAEPPAQVLGNVVLGVRAALDRLDEDPGSLVAAGHSAGGALASDYAAVARSVGLPVPRAVFAAYPGRRFAGARIGIPEAGAIPRGVAVLALQGADDRVVDQGAAREIGARGRLLVIGAAGARDHLAPQRDDAVSRREFWDRLDALIDAARG